MNEEQPFMPPMIIFDPFAHAESQGFQVLAYYECGALMPDGTRKDRVWKRKTVNDPWVEL